MKVPSAIFREYDIRGIVDQELSADFALALGIVFGEHLQSLQSLPLSVSVGRDCRLTSDAYAEALITGLRKTGINIIEIGICPSPLTYFSLAHWKLSASIMVTGSHNPSDYNGFKLAIGANTLHGEEIQTLRKKLEVHSPETWTHRPCKGSLEQRPIIEPYIDWVCASIKHPLQKKKIILDAGNGTASTVAPTLFKRLGAEVIPLYCELDGRFPHHHPDPTVKANLKDLVACVLAEKADFGLAFDGDADRIGLVDERGQILFGDEILIFLARDVLAHNPGATIISEVKSSQRLYDDIALKGGRPIMWKAGHSLIKAKMKETHALLAGEMSGHIFFADRYFGYDDAIYAGVRIYEILSRQAHRKLSEFLEDLPAMCSTPEIRVPCQEALKFQLVEQVKTFLNSEKYCFSEIDGVRVTFTKGWGLIRASNTQPVLVLRFEAEDHKTLNEIQSCLENILERAAQKIGHPLLLDL